MSKPENNETTASAVGLPVEQRVRPRGWLYVAPNGSEHLTRHEDNATVFRALNKGWQAHELYALPRELAEYMLRHLRDERADLEGFLSLGNEASRAERLDVWIAALEGPNVRVEPPAEGRSARTAG